MLLHPMISLFISPLIFMEKSNNLHYILQHSTLLNNLNFLQLGK